MCFKDLYLANKYEFENPTLRVSESATARLEIIKCQREKSRDRLFLEGQSITRVLFTFLPLVVKISLKHGEKDIKEKSWLKCFIINK